MSVFWLSHHGHYKRYALYLFFLSVGNILPKLEPFVKLNLELNFFLLNRAPTASHRFGLIRRDELSLLRTGDDDHRHSTLRAHSPFSFGDPEAAAARRGRWDSRGRGKSGRPGSCFPSKQILAEGETFAEQDKTHKGGGGNASSLRGQPHSPRRGEESRRRPHRARSRIYTNTLCVEITGRVKTA